MPSNTFEKVLNIFIKGFLGNKFISGKRGDFILEIPMLRVPGLIPILKRAGIRLYAFMREAVPIFVLGSVILFVFDELGGLDLIRKASLPIVQGLMGLPGQSVDVFIMTVLRREAGAALLDRFFDREVFNGLQAVVILIVMTTLMPCINAIIVIFKERGIKVSLTIMAVAVFYALFLGTLLNWICTSAGIMF